MGRGGVTYLIACVPCRLPIDISFADYIHDFFYSVPRCLFSGIYCEVEIGVQPLLGRGAGRSGGTYSEHFLTLLMNFEKSD